MPSLYAHLEVLRTRIWFQHSLIILACVFCYGSSLHGDFVFDDAVAIVRNADVTDASRTLGAHILRHDFWGQNLTDPHSHKSYRPLTTLTFRWEHAVFGLRAAPMKLHNFLLHCIVSCLLLRLLPRLFPATDTAMLFAGTALFAVHPVHTEAVSGIVGRAEVLCAVWFMLALHVWSGRVKVEVSGVGAQVRLLGGVFALAALALLSKEVGVMVLPMCLAIDVIDETAAAGRRSLWHRAKGLLRWRCFGLVLMTAALVLVRLWAMDFQSPTFKAMDNPVAAAADLKTRVLSQNYLYLLNIWLLLCPDWLSFDWALGSIELVETFADVRCAAILLFYAVLGGMLCTWRRHNLLALALLIVPFLPGSGIVRVGFVVAERLLYIPSIGFCVLVALGLDRLCRVAKPIRNVVLSAFIALLAVQALRCRWRALEWTDEMQLYKSALRVCPNNAKVHYNIAKMLADRNDRVNAVLFYEHAISLHPHYEAAYTNLGNLYREEHKLDLAEEYLRKAIEIMEEFPPAWMNLGIVLAAQGKYDQSLLAYRNALKYRPRYATCLYNIGNLYVQINDERMALQFWSDAVDLNPRLTKAWANILAAHDNAGRTDEVLRLSESALRLVPDDEAVTVLFIRANAFGKLGRFEEAERIYLAVIGRRSDYALYFVNLGVLYHRWGGHRDQAMAAYRMALDLEPELSSARENLAKLERRTIKGVPMERD